MLYLPPEKKPAADTRLPRLPTAPLIKDWPAFFAQAADQAQDVRLKRFYQAGVPDPQTPLEAVPLLAIDFETTGFNPRKDGIVSIGLIPMTLQRIRCQGAQYWVVRPRSQLDADSVVIHGITHSEIQTAPDLNRCLDDLLRAMAGQVIVVHHQGIERSFLDAALKARLGEGIQFPVIDTMALEARLHRDKRLPWWQRLLGKKPPSIRLADSRSRYGLPYYRPHHALTDALATAELLQAQVAHRFSPQTPVSELWM